MSRRNPAVYGIGQCCLDYLGRIEAFPHPDEKCEFRDLRIDGGGPVATALVALSRWGISTAICGVVGDDGFGAMIVRSLADEGVDAEGLAVREGSESQFAFIVAEPGHGRRTVFWRRPTGAPLAPSEIDLEAIRNTRVFLTDGLYADASIAGALAARGAGIPVVVDAGSLRRGTSELIEISDYFIASSVFAAAYAPGRSLRDVCVELQDRGPGVVCVTRGADGYIARVRGRIIERPAVRIDAVDTTGCGDLFHAGCIFGLLQGWDASESLEYAAWAAAMVSRALGGREAIPDPSEWPRIGRGR